MKCGCTDTKDPVILSMTKAGSSNYFYIAQNPTANAIHERDYMWCHAL